MGQGARGGVRGAEDGLGEGESEPDGGGEDAPVRAEDVEGGDSRAGGERGIGVGEGEGEAKREAKAIGRPVANKRSAKEKVKKNGQNHLVW